MPKRQKAKIPSARTTIERTASPRKLKRIEEQSFRESQNHYRHAMREAKPWDIVRDVRRNKRRNLGLHEKWRKTNASSIGQKPTVSNTAY